MHLVTTMLALLVASAALAQNPVSELGSNGATTPDAITRRLDAVAAEARGVSASGVPRAVEVDVYWPRTADEYRALGKYVIVLVSVVTHDVAELPTARVYIEDSGGAITLQRIGGERRDVATDTLQYAILGAFREDDFYLAPAVAMMNPGMLLADMAVHRTGMPLKDLPGHPPDYIKSDPDPATGQLPDKALLKTVLRREYPGFNPVEEAIGERQ